MRSVRSPSLAPLATVLGNEVAPVLAAIHREHGVRLVTNDQVIGFEGGARADGQGSFYLTQGTLQAELEADAELRACQDLIRGRIRLSEAALADDRERHYLLTCGGHQRRLRWLQ